MTAEALAIVFSPNLLRAPQNDFSIILANMGHTHKLVKALITHVRATGVFSLSPAHIVCSLTPSLRTSRLTATVILIWTTNLKSNRPSLKKMKKTFLPRLRSTNCLPSRSLVHTILLPLTSLRNQCCTVSRLYFVPMLHPTIITHRPLYFLVITYQFFGIRDFWHICQLASSTTRTLIRYPTS